MNLDEFKNYEVPDWYKDAKFGIMTCWGVYSVPARFTEWYPRYLYLTKQALNEPDPFMVNGEYEELTPERKEFRQKLHDDLKSSHIKRYGDPSEFGYKDFIPMFTAPNFSAEKWAKLFARSGAKFMMPVSEHHDGFTMYPSKINPWNAMEMGPKRDIVGELKEAALKEGLRFGVSSHRAWHWMYYNFDESLGYDNTDPQYESFYGKPHAYGEEPSDEFVDDWFERTLELVNNYEPDVMYMDFGWHEKAFHRYYPALLKRFYEQAEERGTMSVLTQKGCLPKEVAVYDIERGTADDIIEPYWQCDTSVSNQGWCHIVNDNTKNPARLIYDLADVVSKNGTMLLNVAPRADGTIPEEMEGTLLAIGNWLDINGEAIYGTRYWKTWGVDSPETIAAGKNTGHYTEALEVSFTHEDIRFTSKGDTVYAIMFDWPGRRAVIPILGKDKDMIDGITQVSLLGCDDKLEWEQKDDALYVTMPVQRPCDHAFALRIES